MIGFIVTSHDQFCIGIKSASEMIGCLNDNCEFISLTNDNMGCFKKEFEEKLTEMHKKYADVIVFTDILCATPYNTASQVIHEHGYKDLVISGVNMNMFMEATLSSSFIENIDELAEIAVKSGKNGITLLDVNGEKPELKEEAEEEL